MDNTVIKALSIIEQSIRKNTRCKLEIFSNGEGLITAPRKKLYAFSSLAELYAICDAVIDDEVVLTDQFKIVNYEE